MSGFTFGVRAEGRRDGLRRGVVSIGGGFLAAVSAAGIRLGLWLGLVCAEIHLDGPISTNDVDVEALRKRMRAFILVDFESWPWKSGMGSVTMWKCGDLCWLFLFLKYWKTKYLIVRINYSILTSELCGDKQNNMQRSINKSDYLVWMWHIQTSSCRSFDHNHRLFFVVRNPPEVLVRQISKCEP